MTSYYTLSECISEPFAFKSTAWLLLLMRVFSFCLSWLHHLSLSAKTFLYVNTRCTPQTLFYQFNMNNSFQFVAEKWTRFLSQNSPYQKNSVVWVGIVGQTRGYRKEISTSMCSWEVSASENSILGRLDKQFSFYILWENVNPVRPPYYHIL